jgi:hypothetical protein
MRVADFAEIHKGVEIDACDRAADQGVNQIEGGVGEPRGNVAEAKTVIVIILAAVIGAAFANEN